MFVFRNAYTADSARNYMVAPLQKLPRIGCTANHMYAARWSGSADSVTGSFHGPGLHVVPVCMWSFYGPDILTGSLHGTDALQVDSKTSQPVKTGSFYRQPARDDSQTKQQNQKQTAKQDRNKKQVSSYMKVYLFSIPVLRLGLFLF